jgi:hypothetical protein
LKNADKQKDTKNRQCERPFRGQQKKENGKMDRKERRQIYWDVDSTKFSGYLDWK